MDRGAWQAAIHRVRQIWTQLKQLSSSSSENGKERTSENWPYYKTIPEKGNYYHNQFFFIILRVSQRLVSTKNQLDKKSDWISERIANVWHCIYPRSTFGPKSEAALKNNRLYSWSLERARMWQGIFFFFFLLKSFILKQNSLFDCLQFPEDPNQKSVIIWPSDKNFWGRKGRLAVHFQMF